MSCWRHQYATEISVYNYLFVPTVETVSCCCAAVEEDDFSCTPIETDDFCCVADDCFSSSVGSSGLEVTMSFSELDIMVMEAPGELPMGGQYSKLMSVLVRRKRGEGR